MINNNLHRLLAIVLLAGSSVVSAQPFVNAAIGIVDPSGDELSSGNVLRLAAGYRFTDLLAVELAVTQFGELDYEEDSSVEYSGEELVLVANSNFNDADNVYFRLGFHNWNADVSGTVDVVSSDSKDSDFVFGAGYARDISEEGALKLELSRYKVGGTDLNVLLGIFEARF